jgi:purine-cytosine permease-like protein
MPEDSPSWKVFGYTALGLTVPTVLIMCLGAAFGSSFTTQATWQAGYDDNSIGGVFGAALAPLNGFGIVLSVHDLMLTFSF